MAPFNVGFVIFPELTQLDFTGPLQVLARLPHIATPANSGGLLTRLGRLVGRRRNLTAASSAGAMAAFLSGMFRR